MDRVSKQFVFNLEVESDEDDLEEKKEDKNNEEYIQLSCRIENKVFTVTIVFSLLCMNYRYI